MSPRRRRTQESPALVAFGKQLRRMREAKQIKQETIAHLTQMSGAQVSRIEAGKRRATRRFVEIVDDHLGAGGALLDLWEELDKDGSPVPAWFDWPQIESDAGELETWQPLVVPGLLQIEGYARAFLETDEAVAARIARQDIITRADPAPVDFVALLGEAVLEYQVGSPEVMREQLEHLLALSERPNITIQLVRNDGKPVAAGGGFVVATMEDRSEVSHIDTSIRGITSDDPADLASLSHQLRRLRAKALPESMSREMVRKALERWT
ncbi:helix-turn-helix domain-containing protein [Actinomadura adrarensis]|uniref:Helix-turn-helix domain-containing protein n=1 Tax=Actinomadura adrarensis TaxID=1819600 RepID=A0ABW3CPU4_9ACTN